MISRLQDPFARSGVPDTVEEYLDTHGRGRCLAFNRRGTLLAVGCTGGLVQVWDFETRGVGKELQAPHAADVVALSWSRDGFRLASAASDGSLFIWDVLSGKPVAQAKAQGTPVRPRVDRQLALAPHAPPLRR